MTVAEGGGRRAVVRKFQDVYLPSLKANFIVWPLVQVLNFRVIPIQFQIVSCPTSSERIEVGSSQERTFLDPLAPLHTLLGCGPLVDVANALRSCIFISRDSN